MRLKDHLLLNLLNKFLKAGCLIFFDFHNNIDINFNISQNSVLSSLMSNIFLHEVDTFFKEVIFLNFNKTNFTNFKNKITKLYNNIITKQSLGLE